MKYGFIGTGNMASAIIKGMVSEKGKIDAKDVLAYHISDKVRDDMDKLGINEIFDIKELVDKSDIVVLSVKPNVLEKVMPSVKECCLENKLVISIAVGKKLEYLEKFLGSESAIVRVMPNINAKVGASTSAFCANKNVTQAQKEDVIKLFSSVGSISEISEDKFSIFGVIAGSAPAFAYMYIDAVARAALKAGMPKAQALEFSAQTVLGSAKMILESGEHPYSLIDQVCSPGGTTIEGISSLQANAFEATVTEAFDAVLEKDRIIASK